MNLILGLFKSAKFWVISAAVIAVSATLLTIWNDRYDQGYDAAELKWTRAQAQAIQDAVDAALHTQELIHAEALANIERETEIVERVRIVERRIPEIVEVSVPAECRDLGPDVLGLWNDAITAAAGESLPAAEVRREPDGALP